MLELIAVTAVGIAGYIKSRNFVHRRLRYVDDIQKPIAPLVAAGVAAAVAAPIVAVLPIVAGGTALVFGAAVGMGTRTGARRIREGEAATGLWPRG
jgi:hypothetical protein